MFSLWLCGAIVTGLLYVLFVYSVYDTTKQSKPVIKDIPLSHFKFITRMVYS